MTLFRNICIPFFSYDGEYLDGNKHSGSQFELHTHFRLLVVKINRKKHSFLWRQSTKPQTSSEMAAGVDRRLNDVELMVQRRKPPKILFKKQDVV